MLSNDMIPFLVALDGNNNREWFQANKKRYEAAIKEPSLAFIDALSVPMTEVSPHLKVIAKSQGGSLFRIYRDVRFSKDKRPYKTHVAMRFDHELGGPGAYFQVSPGHASIGIGMFMVDKDRLAQLRDAVIADPDGFAKAKSDIQALGFDWYGDNALKRGPKGYPKEHPHMDALKRKSWAFVRDIPIEHILEDDFHERLAGYYDEAMPMMRFMADACGLPL